MNEEVLKHIKAKLEDANRYIENDKLREEDLKQKLEAVKVNIKYWSAIRDFYKSQIKDENILQNT